MPDTEAPADHIDWSLTTWDGSRREQLRRWAALPLERIILAIEEMQDLAGQLGGPPTTAAEPAPAAEADLATLTVHALLDLVARDEDRVPRAVVDECARRGDAMVERLETLLAEERYWNGEGTDGEWWLLFHAAMILGLIASQRAGLLLVSHMRRMAVEQDDNLQDWLAEYWPGFFRNKPESVAPALRALAADRAVDEYMRTNAVECALMVAQSTGKDALDTALDWAAGIATDKTEVRSLRFITGSYLLDFPRPRFERMLKDLAGQQRSIMDRFFARKDIATAYESGTDKPGWSGRRDPWEFYLPEKIAERQAQWREEAEELAADVEADEEWGEEQEDDEVPDRDEPGETYIREGPKVGRNDPCPCGSGKKHKKCCLAKDQA